MQLADYERYIRRAVESFEEQVGLTAHQVQSYEHFVNFQIGEIIAENSPISVHDIASRTAHIIHLENVSIGKPVIKEASGFIQKLTPRAAFRRRQSYMADVFVDLRHEVFTGSDTDAKTYRLTATKTFGNVLLFRFPAMRNSSVCHDQRSLDTMRDTASFIISGFEKVMISQEKLKCNFPFVHKAKSISKWEYDCEVRSAHANKVRSTSTTHIYIRQSKTSVAPTVEVTVPFISKEIPLVVLFRLLGVADPQQMLKMITGVCCRCSPHLTHVATSIIGSDSSGTAAYSPEELFNWVGLRGSNEKVRAIRINSMQTILRNEFLPHCQAQGNAGKVVFLGYCVRKLIGVFLEELPTTDIDSYFNKRISTPGHLLALQTRQLVRGAFKQVRIHLHKSLNNKKFINITDFFCHRRISNQLHNAFATGNWGVHKTQTTNQTGVCQILNNVNLVSRLSHKRQINTPLNRDGKQPAPRQLKPSTWGLLCAAETPEGRAVGLLKSFAFLAQVRLGCPSRYVLPILFEDMAVMPLAQYLEEEPADMTVVMLNGIICGFTARPRRLVAQYRKYRQFHDVPVHSSVSYSSGRVVIRTDAGDCVRPLVNLDKLPMLAHVFDLYGDNLFQFWDRLLIEDVIQYINKEEEFQLNTVCDFGDRKVGLHTHMELHPCFTLNGVSAGTSVYSNHNQGPRNIYSSAMSKQAIGARRLDFEERMESKTFFLKYPQKSMVTTWPAEIMGYPKEPCGQACVVAIQCYQGFNQEDSVMISKAALERGLFHTSVCQTYRDKEEVHGADTIQFERCDDKQLAGRRKGNYSNLAAETGIAPVGTLLTKDDVMIGKTIQYTRTRRSESPGCARQFKSERKKRDRSTVIKTDEPCRVQKVTMSRTKAGLRAVSLRTIATRVPEVGDKFASTMAQKGVCGMIVAQEDMCRTAEGITPDIIVNCHAIPSRMTIGQLIENFIGKQAAVLGGIADGTPFRGQTMATIQKRVETLGLSSLGKEAMYSGKTGRMLQHPVFMGITYYQRLKHMVADKMHARNTGTNVLLTRQPVEGRARKGGLRVGEMERDAILSHGCTAALVDRLMKSSDAFPAVSCRTCGFLAEPAAPKNIPSIMHRTPYCRYCDSHANIAHIMIPYAFKLLVQELGAMHVGLKLEV